MAKNMQRMTSKIGKGYRVTLPEAVRQALGVGVGDHITWIIEEGSVTVQKSVIIKCPYCGYEAPLENFTPLREPWRFRFYTVWRLKCPNCGRAFNYYRGRAPSGKLVEYTAKGRG